MILAYQTPTPTVSTMLAMMDAAKRDVKIAWHFEDGDGDGDGDGNGDGNLASSYVEVLS